MLNRITLIGFICLLLGASSCETEFSLNGDYKLTPVVFGLLDQNDSIHLVKITKAYLGDGDNLVYAQIADSNYFNQVDARVIEYDNLGELTGRNWNLTDSIVTGKSTDGIFYAPDQKVYYFNEPNLVSDYIYKIEADIDEGQMSFSAETNLIDGFQVPSTVLSSAYRIRFAKNTVNEDNDYLLLNISQTTGDNAGSFDIAYTFNWTEYYTDGTEANFSLKNEYKKNNEVSAGTRIAGLDFYNWINENIPDDENVDYRIATGIDLRISVANETLTKYMEVAQPVTGIAQVQPVFTNVENGFGLFSSRYLFVLEGLQLDVSSTKELANGQKTITKLFCSPLGTHEGETYGCPE